MSVLRTELLALLLLLASGLCPAYRTGFDADACESLCPVPGCPTNTSAKDAGPKLSDRGFPLSGSFQFSPKMRRTTPFRVNMTSQLAVNALMVLFRDASDDSEARSPQGFFVDWSDSLKPVACEQGPPNALTNKDLSDKDHLWFTWMPPDTAEINVVLRGTFVVGNEYWYNVNVGGDFAVDEFPVSMEGCGDTKSCVTLSRTRAKCDKASRCDLSLTYALGSDNRSLEITMGGAAPVTGHYLALGFTDDPIMLKNANIFACTRTHDLATVQHFTLQDIDSTPVETNQVLEDPSFEQDGERIWCRFSTPVHVAGYDLSLPRHQVYLWGETNVTSQSIKIAPPYMVSKTPIKVGVPIYSRLTRNAATTRTASWIMALATALLARILVA
uniref:Putative secreted protein n=1 Tax=Ixodes ricinus TaxID=34613 RepID=V5HSV7_IXORI